MKRFRKQIAVPILAALVFAAVILPAGNALAYVLPDGNLSYGKTGEAVLSLQQALYEQGYLEAAPDGIFGNLTREALLAFQRDSGIGADAIAGPVTLSVLYGISAEEVRSHFSGSGSNTGSNENGNTDNSNTQTGDTASSKPTLYKGKSGDAVRELQNKLRDLNYLAAQPDGVFGNYTQAAVIAFQQANQLTGDGIVGPLTWAALENAAPRSAEEDPGNASASDPDRSGDNSNNDGNTSAARNLSKGMTGDDVKALQARLAQLGYLQVTPDGIFGNYTQAAVIAFQQKAGISADGVAGPITMAALNNAQGNSNTPNDQNDNTGNTGTASRNLSRGMTGEDVKALQEKLKTLGYLNAAPDGIFGNYTYQAVVAFQKDHKIGQDGVAGPVTMAALNSALASGEPAPQEPETPAEPQVPDDVEPGFTGFRSTSSGDWYFINGHVDTGKTCLVRTTYDGKSGWWYVKNGKVISYIYPPTLTGISNAPGGVEINWNVQEGVQAYRVYWRNSEGEWEFLMDTTDNYYIDTDVESGNWYSYTVRAISKDGSVNLSDYDAEGVTWQYTYQYNRYNASVPETVTKKMLEEEAKTNGFDTNELTAIVAWVEGEAYHLLGEDYMTYLSACVLINGINDGYYGRGEDVLKKIETWGSYYTIAKQKARYQNASGDALRAVYMALKYPTKGIHYCRGANVKPANCFYDSNLFIQGQDVFVW